MQHESRGAFIQWRSVIPGSLAVALAAWSCSDEARPVATPRLEDITVVTTPGEAGPEDAGSAPEPEPTPVAPVPPQPAFAEVRACSKELPACESGSLVPCTLRCGTRANGCEVYSELVPLGPLDSVSLRIGPLDPAGEWAFYSFDHNGASPPIPYLWSAGGGAARLPEALGLPPGPDYDALVVLEVSAGGDAVLLLDLSDYPERGYVWTRDAGLTRLEFEPRDMSADGRVVVGVVQSGAGVIWDPTAGLRYTSGGPVAPEVSDSGEFVLMGTRWSDADGSVRIDRLGLAGAPGLSFGDASGHVILAAYGLWSADGVLLPDQASGLWRWTEPRGAEPLGALPELPAEAKYGVWRSVAEGRVVVGSAATDLSGLDSMTFRWSEELGMESIHEGVPGYVNADGTTIVGGTSAGSFWRWTAAGGSVSVPGPLVALGGDLLIVRDSDGITTSQPLKFDAAQSAALPIDIIEPGLLPGGDEVSGIRAISENGRLLVGESDYRGVSHGWLVRLHDTCDP